MSPARDQSVVDLIDRFGAAAPAELPAATTALTDALWQRGRSTGAAPDAATLLLGRWSTFDGDRQGRLAVLLGLLVDAEYPTTDGPVARAVRAALPDLLATLTAGTPDEPRTLALLYLLGQLPDDRDRILAAAGTLALSDPDRTRLERSLADLDPDAPDLGRCWPSPSVWRLDGEEQQFDQSFIRGLTPEQVLHNWRNDTRMVRSYAGAKAYWAVRYGTPVPVVPIPVPAEDGTSSTDTGPLARYANLFRCPDCGAKLEIADTSARCADCGTTYPIVNGILALASGVRDGYRAGHDATDDLLQKLAAMPRMGAYYESVLRPSFLRLAGSNWGEAVSHADEDRYLATHLAPADAPVLDLAAGAGRWTEVIARAVGAENLIALDMALPMLNVLRARLPEVAAVQASALALPFDDGSLGAVNCWNALHAFPDDAAAALREMGRVLRPGGKLTLMTFCFDPDPVYRFFQESHYFPSRPEGMLLFERDEVRRWLADAGLRIVEEQDPETFFFVTAERTSTPLAPVPDTAASGAAR
ncbi:class I SAM-dependent methyltransferase [Micromonospora cathayae]|uniref:Class I SAM-dependent methyltransferase n=1 Tax=Micromonospora cathayae TaxID=3028804 RepID=A0ABY7ZKM4_9ACTN|nr:class I SAM-dependent methyltransferase [Micromonospora sp. HUAS 3]WDZ83500.1 class I SAM-dependent methyltransferase [Micromonospora sp. HUAS 3]